LRKAKEVAKERQIAAGRSDQAFKELDAQWLENTLTL
jgi:hypothetical protein